jgi:acetyl-CoA C-acetyltransferase/potassium large conductance calcium-activated channel subfamily M alpha protein 1
MKAKQVVILTPNVGKAKKTKVKKEDDEEEEENPDDEENLLDAQTIFKYNIIKKKNPNVNVVTELINENNIAYLLNNPLLYTLLNDYKYDQTPVFAAGEVYLSSLMDALTC